MNAPGSHHYRLIWVHSSHLSTIYYYSPAQLIRGYFDDSGRYNYSFHYLNGQSISQISGNGEPSYSIYYIWNSQSLVDSSDQLNQNGGIGIRKTYAYDGNGFLSNVKWYNDDNTLVLTESYTVSSGNITQHTYNVLDSSNASLPGGTYTYTYYTGQTNTLSNLYFGQAYLGASSANPVKSVTYTNGSTTTVVDYAYHYTNGYITSQLVYADSMGVSGRRVDSLGISYYFQ